LYDSAKKRDDEEMKQFYKMIKYAKLKAPLGDLKALSIAKKIQLDLVTIPEEFKDIPIDDYTSTNKRKRKYIKTKSNADLTNYDCWRVHDREIMKGGHKEACNRIIELPPALIVRAFGLPTQSRMGFTGTGEYDFEDVNFDVYNICDYKQTDFYHGLNREDQYYEKELSKRPHLRKRKWPTV
jgi:hypothetical protein